MKKFTIITRSSCPFCDKAKQMITDRGDSYIEYIIGETITREEVLDKYPTRVVLPILILDDEEIGHLPDLLDFYNNH